jgi:hypothetical protein
VGALYCTAAKFNFPAGDTVGFEYVEADCRTYNVNDRIKCADFMKGNFVHSFSMYLCFSLCDAGEYGERPLFRSHADTRLLYESANVFPCTMMVRSIVMMFVRVVMVMKVGLIVMMLVSVIMVVRVGFIVMMFVRVIMMVRARLIVMMFMRVIMRDVIGLSVQLNHSVHTADAATLITLKVQVPAIYAEFAQFIPQFIGGNAQINQSAERHISGYTGKTVKMKCFHTYLLVI